MESHHMFVDWKTQCYEPVFIPIKIPTAVFTEIENS